MDPNLCSPCTEVAKANSRNTPLDAVTKWVTIFDLAYKASNIANGVENYAKIPRYPDKNDKKDPWILFGPKLWAALQVGMKGKNIPLWCSLYGHYHSATDNRTEFLRHFQVFYDEKTRQNRSHAERFCEIIYELIGTQPGSTSPNGAVNAARALGRFWSKLGQLLTDFVMDNFYSNTWRQTVVKSDEATDIAILNDGLLAATPCAARQLSREHLEQSKYDNKCPICRFDFFETICDDEELFAQALSAMSLEEQSLVAEQLETNHIPIQLPCGHLYGLGCIRTWLIASPTCPLCSKTIFSPPTDWWNFKWKVWPGRKNKNSVENVRSEIRDVRPWGTFSNVSIEDQLRPWSPTEEDGQLPMGYSCLVDVPHCVRLVANHLRRPDLANDSKAQPGVKFWLVHALAQAILSAMRDRMIHRRYRWAVNAMKKGFARDFSPWTESEKPDTRGMTHFQNAIDNLWASISKHNDNGKPTGDSDEEAVQLVEMVVDLLFNHYRGVMLAIPRIWWAQRERTAKALTYGRNSLLKKWETTDEWYKGEEFLYP